MIRIGKGWDGDGEGEWEGKRRGREGIERNNKGSRKE